MSWHQNWYFTILSTITLASGAIVARLDPQETPRDVIAVGRWVFQGSRCWQIVGVAPGSSSFLHEWRAGAPEAAIDVVLRGLDGNTEAPATGKAWI